MTTGIEQMTLSYERTNELSMMLLGVLSGAEVPVSYSTLACALTIARLQTNVKLEEDEEIQFMQDMMSWTQAYWGSGKDKKAS